jgi:dihydroneopterin aldolase
MDTIFIEGLPVETSIGIYTGEQDRPQTVVIDLQLGFDNTLPAATGILSDTVDYAGVVAAIRAFVSASGCGLVEQLAEDCCSMLRQRFARLLTVDIRIDKPGAARALGCASIGVRIRRGFN